MTYAPKPIDFCDHVGHGKCGDCPDDPETVEDVRLDVATYPHSDVVLVTREERLAGALRLLLAAFPKLRGEFSTAEQQRVLRAAHAALEDG